MKLRLTIFLLLTSKLAAFATCPSEVSESAGANRGFRAEIQRLIEIGLESDDVIGFHGTSLQALIHLEQYGYLPAGRIDGGHQIYFAPISGRIPGAPKIYLGDTAADAENDGKAYAGMLAQRHGFLAALGLDISLPKNAWVEDVLIMNGDADKIPQAMAYLSSLGIQKQRVFDAKELVRHRRGVVISISARTLEKYPATIGDHERNRVYDLKFDLDPEGLPIELISGIEPLSDYEWDYFDSSP